MSWYDNSKRNSKLKPEDVQAIRDFYETGEYTLEQLGEMFGVKDKAISHIINRRTWKNI